MQDKNECQMHASRFFEYYLNSLGIGYCVMT